jgi:HEPN domain-containing protein/predicted nucleotidyltransferase
MAPATRFPLDDPREWLNRARSNLRRAAVPAEGIYLEDLCYDAQQAAEKAIKAVFIARGVRFPFVHDLDALLTALEESGQAVPEAVRSAAWLTRFAREARYPTAAVVDEAEHGRAVAAARAVVGWSEGEVGRPGRLREQPAGRYPSQAPRSRTRGPGPTASPASSPATSPDPSPGRDAAPDPALLKQVVERIVAAADPDRVILFGSGARGCMGPHSDLDLLVVKDGDWDRHEVDLAIRRSLRGLAIAIDLVLATPGELERYGRAIGLVYQPALVEGQVVYEGPAVRTDSG